MEKISNNELIKIIIDSNGGYITRKNINEHNISSMFLSNYVKKYSLIKYGTGFYATKEWIRDDYFIFQYEYPRFIYSFYSAAYLHQLGDYMPPYLEVTGPKNYRPFEMPKRGVVIHTDTKPEIYSLGVTEIKTIFGNKIRVYDAEKTVCDFIKNRKKIDSESFVKCINWYKKIKNKNRNNLMKYAKTMKIEEEVFNLMEVVLNED